MFSLARAGKQLLDSQLAHCIDGEVTQLTDLGSTQGGGNANDTGARITGSNQAVARVFKDDTFLDVDPDLLGSGKETFRVGFGFGDHVARDDLVKHGGECWVLLKQGLHFLAVAGCDDGHGNTVVTQLFNELQGAREELKAHVALKFQQLV